MADAHDRRRFFRELIRGAAQAAEEIGSALRAESAELFAQPDPYEPLVQGAEALHQETVAAAPARRLVALDELPGLCADVGLEAWAGQTAAAARLAIRLTRGEGGASRLGGHPTVPAGFAWPSWRGEELTLLAQVRLDELPESPLPRSGTLLVFYAVAAAPSGLDPADGGGCQVVFVEDEAAELREHPGALPELPVVPSPELMLPLETPVESPEPAQLAAWVRLRERVAELQGVELAERAGSYLALHRLLGHPDTLAEGMELEAQLVANGIDLNTGERYFHPRIGELESGAADWRLLFQLSTDDELGVAFGWYGRLYVWIRDEDLRAGRFGMIRAFAR